MPTYDYACSACGHQFEEYQSITAEPLKKCPSCGKNRLERLIGPGGGLIFKGSGFYITDYRSEGYKKAAEAETKPAAAADTGKSGTGGAAAEPAKPAPAQKPAKPEKKPPTSKQGEAPAA